MHARIFAVTYSNRKGLFSSFCGCKQFISYNFEIFVAVKFDVGRTLKAGIRFEKKHEQNNRAASRVVNSRFQVIFFLIFEC